MHVSYQKGLALGQSLIVDPMIKRHAFDRAIVTHAHSDHVCLNKSSQFYSTPETQALLHLNYAGKESTCKPLKLGKKVQLNGLEVSLHSAGHILGSAQVFIQNQTSLAITSDFKLQSSLTEQPAELLQADTLVMESTFGLPEYKFPEREQVYAEMASWAKKELAQGHFVVFTGYALGKAQELTVFCNQYLNQAPLVHEKIFANNQVYEKFGTKLGPYYKMDHNLKDSNILIFPPNLLNADVVEALEMSLHRKVSTARASGWPHKHFYDRVFSISDHADYNQLMEYVKQCNPKLVLTMHGFAKEFAWHVQKKLGIPARPLNGLSSQSLLQEFD